MLPTRRRQRTAGEPGSGAVTTAVKAAGRFDRSNVSVAAGLLAAIPVVTVLGLGIALGYPVYGVLAGAGAMLLGVAWRTAGGRPPLMVMTVDAAVMALSTFVGCVTGSVTWLHLILLCVWSLMGGLLVVVGNRGGVIGTQAIIAVVVFGRFSEPAAQALGLAALVLTGGFAQVLFLSIIRWPLPLRAQRLATAAAYRELATLAAAPDETSTLAPATALDDAESSLASPTLFGDATLAALRSLVSEAYRLRVQIVALHVLLRQKRAGGQASPGSIEADARQCLALAESVLDLAAHTILGDKGADDLLQERVAEIGAEVEAYSSPTEDGRPPSAEPAQRQIARRLAALAGQLRAVGSLASVAGAGGRLRSRRPMQMTNRPLHQLRTDLAQVRANMSLDSPVGRHAVRLAVVVPAAELIARELPLSRSYWMVVAAATVLRPEFGATFTRGAERALGTCFGVALAGAIAVAAHPSQGVTVALVGVLAWAAYAVFPASFAAGYGFITAVTVFLLNAVSPDTLATASARLLDTLIGGTLGLLVYAAWPTWSRTPAWQALADLVAAERAYLDTVLRALTTGQRAPEQQVTTLSRRARLARTKAEATVARSLSEPVSRRIDARQSNRALGALRRLIQAAHVVRIDAQDDRDRRPIPQLEPLGAGIDQLLTAVETAMRAKPDESPPTQRLPDLRALYDELRQASHQGEGEPSWLLIELDEIVDAADGLASQTGLASVDDVADEADDEPQGWRTSPARLFHQWLPRRT